MFRLLIINMLAIAFGVCLHIVMTNPDSLFIILTVVFAIMGTAGFMSYLHDEKVGGF